MATNPLYTTQAPDQYPLGETFTLDSNEVVEENTTYATDGVYGGLGASPDSSGSALGSATQVTSTSTDGSGGAFAEPADTIVSTAAGGSAPLVPAILLDTNEWGLNSQANGLLVNPTANGGGGGNSYLTTGNQAGTANTYNPPTYPAAVIGTTDTQTGGGSPIQQANPAYRASEAYPAATILDTSRTDSPVTANNSSPYGNETLSNILQTMDTMLPVYPMQDTTTTAAPAPANAPTAVAANRSANITIQTVTDPTGAKIHGYIVQAVHLKTGYVTQPGNAWAGDSIAATGVDLFTRTITSQTFLTAPAAPVPVPAATGGTVATGTYQVVLTYTNAAGETTGSVAGPVTTTANTSTITIPSPTAQTGATGWYAYVTQVGGAAATATRQQAAGSPTAIGTNLVITAPPTSTGALAPSTNTAVTGSFVTDNIDTLIPGDSYAFRYATVNSNGMSAFSPWSNIVKPLLTDEVPTGSLDPANTVNPIYLPDGTVHSGSGGTTGPVNPDTGSFIVEPVAGQPTQLGVTFTAPTWGTPTGYTINTYRYNPGNPLYGPGTLESQDLAVTQNAGASPSFPIIVTGLIAGTEYVVEVIPFTAVGNGVATYSEVVIAGGPTEPETAFSNETTVNIA